MPDKKKAVLTAVAQIILYILFPIVALNYLPANIMETLQIPEGFGIQNIIMTIVVVGLAITALTYIKNITEESSPFHLLSSIGLQAFMIYLFLFFVGFGNPWSFGKTVTTFDIGVPVTITFDLQFFAVVATVIVLLKVGIIFLEFSQSRIKKE